MKSNPYLIKPDKSGQVLVPLNPEKRYFDECWLQELLLAYPDILPVDEIEPVYWPLVPIGREIPTRVGMIDNLFISKSGYPVIVETKLWRNPQAKREVIAQAIDYASELCGWTFEELDKETYRMNNKHVVELIQSHLDLDADQLPSEEAINKNLKLGRFLILVVADQIRTSLFNMLNYMNRFPHLATNVGLVELRCYTTPDRTDEIIVFPSVVAKTEIIERSIVQVTLSPDIAHKLNIEQKKIDISEGTGKALTEDLFWELLSRNSPKSVQPAKQILGYFADRPGILLQMRKTAIVVRLELPETEQRLSLFFIDINGNLECWTADLIAKLASLGIDAVHGQEYTAYLATMLKYKRKTFSIYEKVENINKDHLVEAVEKFREAILKNTWAEK